MRAPERNYVRLLRVLALTGVAHAATQLSLHVYFGDAGLARYDLGALACSSIVYALAPRIAPSRRAAAGHAFNLVNLAIVTWVYPVGAGSGVFFVAFCLAAVALAPRPPALLALLSAAAVVYLAVPGPRDYATPTWLSFAAATLVSYFQFYGLLRDDRSGLQAATARVAEEEVALEREARAVAARRAEVDRLGAGLAEARARLERELALETAVTERLRGRRREERALVDAMHHGMREPLRSIVSFNQLIARRLRRRGVGARAEQYLDFVADAGLRMARMLDDLLAYSVTARAAAAAPEVVDLNATLAAARANLSDLLARTGATLAVAPGLPVIRGHATPLLQLFQNLVTNALKFSRPGVAPVVDVRAAATPTGEMAVTVTDNGVGIAPEHLASVFELFGRGEADEASEGSGVGLALCRRVARQHGGTLAVASVPGEGSAFSLVLPADVLVATDVLVAADVLVPAEAAPPGTPPSAVRAAASEAPNLVAS